MVIKRKLFGLVLVVAIITVIAAVAGFMPRSVKAENDASVKVIEAKTDAYLSEPDVLISLGEGWEHDYAVSAAQGDIEYYSKYKGSFWMQFDSPILKVYEITLTDKDTGKEIININSNVVITLRVPDNLIGQKFDIRRCNYTFQKLAEKMDYTLSADGKYASFTTDEMRPFMVVCDGESFLIPVIVALVLVVALGVLLIVQVYKKSKDKKKKKAAESETITAAAFAPLALTFYVPSHMLVFVILCIAFVALAILNIIFFKIGRNIPEDEVQDEKEKSDEDKEDIEESENGEEKKEQAKTPAPEPEKPAEEKPVEEEKPETPEEIVAVPVAETEKKEKTEDIKPAPVVAAVKTPEGEKEKRDRSFLAKLIQSSPSTKNEYSAIKNKLLSIVGSESRVSWVCDVISTDEHKLAEIRLKGDKVYCVFALGENGKMLKSDVDVGVAALCRKYGLKKSALKRDDYYTPYLDDAELEKRGLIK